VCKQLLEILASNNQVVLGKGRETSLQRDESETEKARVLAGVKFDGDRL